LLPACRNRRIRTITCPGNNALRARTAPRTGARRLQADRDCASIGRGRLSLGTCTLYNEGNCAARKGEGPRDLSGDSAKATDG
jgi:hypothetical protein